MRSIKIIALVGLLLVPIFVNAQVRQTPKHWDRTAGEELYQASKNHFIGIGLMLVGTGGNLAATLLIDPKKANTTNLIYFSTLATIAGTFYQLLAWINIGRAGNKLEITKGSFLANDAGFGIAIPFNSPTHPSSAGH